jgi:hypothetical protein
MTAASSTEIEHVQQENRKLFNDAASSSGIVA